MRMKYEKPCIAVERYELSQAISACATKINMLSSACVLGDDDAPLEMKQLAFSGLFTSGYCSQVVKGGQSSTGICYHTNANAAFSS